MEHKIKTTSELSRSINSAIICATLRRNEFLMPEHLLYGISNTYSFSQAMQLEGYNVKMLRKSLHQFFDQVEKVPEEIPFNLEFSSFYDMLRDEVYRNALASEATEIDIPHVVNALLHHDEIIATQMLRKAINSNNAIDDARFLSTLCNECAKEHAILLDQDECHVDFFDEDKAFDRYRDIAEISAPDDDEDVTDDDEDDFSYDNDEEDEPNDHAISLRSILNNSDTEENAWLNYVKRVEFDRTKHNPLIGRENELARTIQVLCRKEKNNPLHVGDPGVGKTAIIYGLAERISQGKVPNRLKNAKIFQLNLSDLVVGTQYRGDFEKRVKDIMDGISKEGQCIVYIDEIHNIVGTGATDNSHIDVANMLKPYIEGNNVQFIGSTTFADFKRSLANSRGIMRHFQQIDILEPSIDEAVTIVNGLKDKYEAFHGVKYSKSVIEYAVRASARYINNRALPDKAIDLIDEAGAYLEIHPDGKMIVTREHIAQILAKVCKVEHLAEENAEEEQLDTLYTRINAKIYGQDQALKSVVEAVQMSRAGLLDDNKPVASLLFVGPTGVGKTEVARVLAQEMGMNLVRFDMSEYAEKHTVAKLIGSPAGYVGYEDGGLLTDAIRRTPNCVLLLDEIEKAHPDIYNILLQVMDYASLTDNRGNKADFRHVILIMTSNAGAQHSGRANVGFTGTVRRGDAMVKAVKSTFKPEFINRLSSVVVFNDLSRQMATQILEKRIGELSDKLQSHKIELSLSENCREWLLNKGFTPEYGARELDRVISQNLKTKLMREILFGSLKKGGNAVFDIVNDELVISVTERTNAPKVKA